MPVREASWLEAIVGSMFSGKSEELIRRVKRAAIAKQHVLVFKPALDWRYGQEKVAAHNGLHIDCYPIQRPEEILQMVDDRVDVVADEVRFLTPPSYLLASAWSGRETGYCGRLGPRLSGGTLDRFPS